MTLVFGLEGQEGCKVAANIFHGYNCIVYSAILFFWYHVLKQLCLSYRPHIVVVVAKCLLRSPPLSMERFPAQTFNNQEQHCFHCQTAIINAFVDNEHIIISRRPWWKTRLGTSYYIWEGIGAFVSKWWMRYPIYTIFFKNLQIFFFQQKTFLPFSFLPEKRGIGSVHQTYFSPKNNHCTFPIFL